MGNLIRDSAFPAEQEIQIGSIKTTTPNIGFGSYHLADKPDTDVFTAMTDAYEAGVTLFDTSDNYGTEIYLGALIRSGVLPRNEIIIATKTGLGQTYEQQQEWTAAGRRYNTDPSRMRTQLDASLGLLAVDNVDLYQLHVHDETVPIEDHVEILNEFIESGKITEYGLSNYYVPEFTEFLSACDRLGLRRPAAIQPYYNMLSDTQDIVDMAISEGIVVLAHSPLLKGALTDKRLPVQESTTTRQMEDAETDDDLRSVLQDVKSTISDLRDLSELASTEGFDLAQVAIAWVAMMDNTVVLTSATNPSYLKDAISASRWAPNIPDAIKDGVLKLRSKPSTKTYASVNQTFMRHVRGY